MTNNFEKALVEYKKISDIEFSERIESSLNTIAMYALTSRGDEAYKIHSLLLAISIYIAKGKNPSEKKKESIILSCPEDYRELIRQQKDVYFGDNELFTTQTAEELISSLPMAADAVLDLMLSFAHVGGEVDNTAIRQIKKIFF